MQLQNIVTVPDCLDLLLEDGVVLELKSPLMFFFKEVYLKTERDFDLTAYSARIRELLQNIVRDIKKFLELHHEVRISPSILL